MSHARFLVGDVRERMAEIPDGSIDLVLTSPPFLALRSYLPPDHPDKGREIGSEPTPAEFLDTLLVLTARWRELLAPHGSIAVELGDTYSGSGGGGGDYLPGGLREGQQQFAGSAATMRESNAAHWRQKNADKGGWPLPKSLCGIPHLYHLSLAYGRNLLTGEPSPAGEWRVRNVVAWCRPNPPVGRLGDKVRPATSYMTIATPSIDRYFDLAAVSTPNDRTAEPVSSGSRRTERLVPNGGSGRCEPRDAPPGRMLQNNPAGAPPLDHWWFDDVFDQDAWLISTSPYPGSHYATWPPELCTLPIKAMVPHRVCTTCGEPSRPIMEGAAETDGGPRERDRQGRGRQQRTEDDPGRLGLGATGTAHSNAPPARAHVGWTDCGHDTWRNGIVLDPFAGSGTTLSVATGHGRDCIGIDLDERNADLARERVGMFLDVEYPAPTPELLLDPT